MRILPLFDLGQQGKSASVCAQRHLGLYAEASGDKTRLAFYGTPGKTLDYTFGDTPIRGSIPVGDYTYHVHRGTFWEVNNAGIKVSRGTIGTTSGRVYLAFNGTQIALVDGSAMYCYTIATTAFVTVTSGLFANPIDLTYQDGYGIATFENSQVRQISALYDFTTWDALEFDSAESNPDDLLRTISDHGELVSCGALTIEFAANTGGQDYAFSALKSSTLEYGLAAPDSLVKFNDSLALLAKNTMGQVQVMMMRGHALQPISSQEMDYIINGYNTVSDATGSAYMLGGHPMYQLNFPSEGKSWMYDASNNLWSELESGLNGGRDRGEIRYDYLNKPRCTDYENGNVYTVSPDVYTDNGTTIPREIISKHFFIDENEVTVHELQLQIEAGVGLVSGQGSDPQVMLQISKDGGKTWGNERWATIGKIGKFKNRARWTRLGSGRDWVFKFRITDPVKVAILGGGLRYEARNA